MNQPKLLRRTFLQHLGAAGAGTLAATASTPGSGESPGLKALVCVYLEGGNDSANMLIPCDPTEHAAYTAARPHLALPLSPQREAPWHVLPLTGAGRPAGIHSAMPELRDLFAAGRVSFMANTGPRSANQHDSPTRTGSHRDQSTQWQTGDSDGIYATGWAGRMAHVLQKRMPVKTASTEPDALWLAGAGEVKTLSQENTLADFPGCHFSPLLRNGPAMHGLATQIQAVARDISTGSAGSRFYFVRMPGFDTHADQSKTHATLLRALSAGIAAFASSMSTLGMADQVTLFTMSDFGRALHSGVDGSDHGWGGDSIVLGGALPGGRIHGHWPVRGMSSALDSGRGIYQPTTSTVEYASLLGRWMGLTEPELRTVFPDPGSSPAASELS